MTRNRLYEAKIILPELGNTGLDITPYHDKLVVELVARWGGVTITEASGCWNDPVAGKRQDEFVLIFTVAMPLEDSGILRGVAVKLARETGQQEIYVRFPDDHVEFIKGTTDV